eukprot:scaffold3759_cov61-Cyclotella_meneghiniana.AAC.3
MAVSCNPNLNHQKFLSGRDQFIVEEVSADRKVAYCNTTCEAAFWRGNENKKGLRDQSLIR